MNTIQATSLIISAAAIATIAGITYLQHSGTTLISGGTRTEAATDKVLGEKSPALEKSLKELLSQEKGNWSLLVQEMGQEPVLAIDAKKSRPAASLMKIVTAVTVLQKVEKGDFSLELEVNGTTVSSLLEAMVNRSDNDSWEVLNSLATFPSMHRVAGEIGMKNTNVFTNETTANDMDLFLKQLYEGKLVTKEHRELLFSLMQKTETENRIPEGVPDSIKVVHKTGTLDGVVHDAAIVMTDQPYILVIMGESESTEEGSKTISRISHEVYQSLE